MLAPLNIDEVPDTYEHIYVIYARKEKRVVIRIDVEEFLTCGALIASLDDLAKKGKDISSIDELVEIRYDDSWIAGDEALRRRRWTRPSLRWCPTSVAPRRVPRAG
jgi:hypothetical protein